MLVMLYLVLSRYWYRTFIQTYSATSPLKSTLGNRGASRGSVWLSWQTALHHRYSALKPIKYHTLSLQVS